MVQKANGSNNLAAWFDILFGRVAWVADNKWCLGSVFSTSDSDSLSIFEQNLVNLGVEHVSSSMNCAKSGESLRKTSKTVDWVQERRVTISSNGLEVKLDLENCVCSWLVQVIVCSMECHGVTKEINRVRFKFVVLVNVTHVLVFHVDCFPGRLVVQFTVFNILVKVHASLLLEQAHEFRLESLHIVGWYFCDSHLFFLKHTCFLMLGYI